MGVAALVKEMSRKKTPVVDSTHCPDKAFL
jgi:hypothetical protein